MADKIKLCPDIRWCKPDWDKRKKRACQDEMFGLMKFKFN